MGFRDREPLIPVAAIGARTALLAPLMPDASGICSYEAQIQ
jgi:hypothetical protein